MDKHSLPDMPAAYWYGKPGAVEHLFWGVFEGGGAKGAAYSGALLAMAEEKCWFRGVAGASAGSITAALVASGLSPEEMEIATDSALRQVQTGVWAGLRRLQDITGYFPSDKLRAWLEGLLAEQVAKRTGAKPDKAVTFKQLFAATEIELNVVAADLSLRSQMIFSHHDTPNCAVADAVVASSAIPFAFASGLLCVREGSNSGPISHHTIVDGGVWSNFPMYVFEDKAFRGFYKRDPVEIDSRYVLGFLLDEGGDQTPPRGEDVKFVETGQKLLAREWSEGKPATVDAPSSLWFKIGAALFYPFYLLGRFVEWNSGFERGRWPTPRSKLAKTVVQSFTGLLGGIYPLFFAILPCALVAIGAWEIGGSLVAEQLRVIPETDWTDPFSYVARPAGVLLALLLIALAILVLFATVLVVVANRILLRAVRRILYGLVTTYVAGSGAPEWVVKTKGNIVALPIPEEVTTLSFNMTPIQRRQLIALARQTTLDKLAKVLS